MLQSHFPIGRKAEGIPVEFTWYEAFQPNKKGVSNSITYEKASVLFNLAAVCSQESLANDLTTDGGLKASARHFQVSFKALGSSMLLCTPVQTVSKAAAALAVQLQHLLIAVCHTSLGMH